MPRNINKLLMQLDICLRIVGAEKVKSVGFVTFGSCREGSGRSGVAEPDKMSVDTVSVYSIRPW